MGEDATIWTIYAVAAIVSFIVAGMMMKKGG